MKPELVRMSTVGKHTHTWDPTRKNTSRDDGHRHGVTRPSSGFTDRGGRDGHKHELELERE